MREAWLNMRMGISREVEAKWRLDNESEIVAWLDARYGVAVQQHQVDHIYTTGETSLLDLQPGAVVLRVRQEATAQTLTVKKMIRNGLDKAEAEVAVASAADTTACLVLMGYNHALTLRKNRQQWVLDNHVTACVDQVVGLGSFLEVEWITDDAEVGVGELIGRLSATMPGLVGMLASETRVFDGYDVLYQQQT